MKKCIKLVIIKKFFLECQYCIMKILKAYSLPCRAVKLRTMTRARRVEMTKKMNNGHTILIRKRKWEVPRGNLSAVRVKVLNRILKITREELDMILLQIDRVKR